ncbi:MAG: VWA domain-containing protein [Saprospiraceae bacterium]|nr:VWA domain-containing protein [Saprospiraceae bacterium]
MQQFLFLLLFSSLIAIPQSFQNENAASAKIQIALLLDTSNSMDGLIDQAKSQLWKIVNDLAISTQNGQIPSIEISLYAYGNDDFNGKQGYVKQIEPLITDLDQVSDALFRLQTKGGSEYCGEVIYQSLQQLPWSGNKNDFKLIVIAGNEPFTQGPTAPNDAYNLACSKGIAVTTIFCGEWQEGINTGWKDAPTCLESDYFNIDQDQAVAHIPTPYDEEIVALNQSLNGTYLAYGIEGESRMELQSEQDKNASVYGYANLRERVSFKSKAQYNNASWDLVDAYADDEAVIKDLEEDQLPEVLQGKTAEEKRTIISAKQKERAEIKEKIKTLETKANQYIAAAKKDQADEMTLDAAIMKSIRAAAAKKGFSFK